MWKLGVIGLRHTNIFSHLFNIMPIANDMKLYEKVKQDANRIYGKPSAYKSGWIVKTYKQRGGTYSDDGKPKELKRWFNEEWADIGGKEYPVYRPFKRINESTPLTAFEIDPVDSLRQIELKQILKGDSNLPPFLAKGSGIKSEEIYKYSNPEQAQKRAFAYLGKSAKLFLSDKPDKKYMILDPNTNKWIHFGAFKPPMEDFTKHQDSERRRLYLARATKIKGNWKSNPYSPNNLAINILW
jgi:hypothetical protein